jgi:hypothetical protein
MSGFKNVKIQSLILVFPSLPTTNVNDATVDRKEFLSLSRRTNKLCRPSVKAGDATGGGCFFVAKREVQDRPNRVGLKLIHLNDNAHHHILRRARKDLQKR